MIILLFPQNYTDWLGGAVPIIPAMHDDQQFQYGGVLFIKCFTHQPWEVLMQGLHLG